MIVTLTGDNTYALQSEQARLVADFVAEYGDLALERLDGEDNSFEQIQAALTSLPFLASKKMVILRAPSTQKVFTEKAPELLADLPDSTDVILIESKLDKRLSYYKFLYGKTDYRALNQLDRSGLINWLVQSAKEQGGELSSSDAGYLADRVGLNQQALSTELDKLITYSPKITRTSIDELVDKTPQSVIFDLLDAAFAGHNARALQIYTEQRTLGEEPQKIIGLMAWQLHIMAVAVASKGKPSAVVAKEAKLNPYVVQKATNLTKNMSLSSVKSLVDKLLKIDVQSKSSALDLDAALKNYLATIA